MFYVHNINILHFKLGAALAVPVDNGRFNIFLSYCIAGGFGVFEYDAPDGLISPFQTVHIT